MEEDNPIYLQEYITPDGKVVRRFKYPKSDLNIVVHKVGSHIDFTSDFVCPYRVTATMKNDTARRIKIYINRISVF